MNATEVKGNWNDQKGKLKQKFAIKTIKMKSSFFELALAALFFSGGFFWNIKI